MRQGDGRQEAMMRQQHSASGAVAGDIPFPDTFGYPTFSTPASSSSDVHGMYQHHHHQFPLQPHLEGAGSHVHSHFHDDSRLQFDAPSPFPQQPQLPPQQHKQQPPMHSSSASLDTFNSAAQPFFISALYESHSPSNGNLHASTNPGLPSQHAHQLHSHSDSEPNLHSFMSFQPSASDSSLAAAHQAVPHPDQQQYHYQQHHHHQQEQHHNQQQQHRHQQQLAHQTSRRASLSLQQQHGGAFPAHQQDHLQQQPLSMASDLSSPLHGQKFGQDHSNDFAWSSAQQESSMQQQSSLAMERQFSRGGQSEVSGLFGPHTSTQQEANHENDRQQGQEGEELSESYKGTPTMGSTEQVGGAFSTPQGPRTRLSLEMNQGQTSPTFAGFHPIIRTGSPGDLSLLDTPPPLDFGSIQLGSQPRQVQMPMLHLQGLTSRDFASPDSGSSSALSSAFEQQSQSDHDSFSSGGGGGYVLGAPFVPSQHMASSSHPMSRAASSGISSVQSHASSSSSSSAEFLPPRRPRSHTTLTSALSPSARQRPYLHGLVNSVSAYTLGSEPIAPLMPGPAMHSVSYDQLCQSPQQQRHQQQQFHQQLAPHQQRTDARGESPGSSQIDLPSSSRSVAAASQSSWQAAQVWSTPSHARSTTPSLTSLTDSQASARSRLSGSPTDFYDARYTDAKLSAALEASATLQAQAASSMAGTFEGTRPPPAGNYTKEMTFPPMRRAISSGEQVLPTTARLAQGDRQSPGQGQIQPGYKSVERRSSAPSKAEEQSQPILLPGMSPGEPLHQMDSANLAENVRNYLCTPNRINHGERTIMIMTPRVAQKSYGTEKRFLCPPPMLQLTGCSWWNACAPSREIAHAQHATASGREPFLASPRVSTKILGEAASFETELDWSSASGDIIDVGTLSREMAVSGQSMYRQMSVSDTDDKAARKDVIAEVAITIPALSAVEHKLLGQFHSRPIRVISKPSKKRQSARGAERE